MNYVKESSFGYSSHSVYLLNSSAFLCISFKKALIEIFKTIDRYVGVRFSSLLFLKTFETHIIHSPLHTTNNQLT